MLPPIFEIPNSAAAILCLGDAASNAWGTQLRCSNQSSLSKSKINIIGWQYMHAWYHQYMLHSLDISTSAPFHLSVLFWSILNRQVPSEKRKDSVVQFSWARGGFNPTEPPGCYSSLKHLQKPTAFIVFKLLGCSQNMSVSNSWTMSGSNSRTMLGIHTYSHTHIPGLQHMVHMLCYQGNAKVAPPTHQ